MHKLPLYLLFCFALFNQPLSAADIIGSYDDVLMIYDQKGQAAALEALKSLAVAGDPEGQYQLGQRYLLGEDMPQDMQKALHWLETAAKQDHSGSMMTLSQVYTSGLGIPINTPKAIYWLKKVEKLSQERAAAAEEELSSDCD